MAVSRFSTSSVAQGLPKYQSLKTNPSEITSGLQIRLDAGSYSGSGNWLDTSGNSRNGTLNNITFTSNGAASYFNFNGSDSYVNLGSTSIQSSATTPLSFEIWLYTSNVFSTSGTYMMPIRGAAYDGNEYFTAIGNNAGAFYINSVFRTHTQWANTTKSRSDFEGKWVQFVTKYTGGDKDTASSYIQYINGVSIGSGATNYGGAGGSANYNIIGKDSYGTGPADTAGAGAFSGKVGHYKAYNRALTDAEVLQNFNALRGRYGL
jgi:hypothetical protein